MLVGCLVLGPAAGQTCGVYFLPDSIASPFLHATIFTFAADTISFDSILNCAFLTINVQTSSQRRYVCRWPWSWTPR